MYLYLRHPVEQGVWHCCEGGGTWSNPVGNQLQSTTATLTNDHCQLYNCARQCTWRHQCVLCNQPSLVELSVNSTSSKQWSQVHPMYCVCVYMCTFMCTKLVLPTYVPLCARVWPQLHPVQVCKYASVQVCMTLNQPTCNWGLPRLLECKTPQLAGKYNWCFLYSLYIAYWRIIYRQLGSLMDLVKLKDVDLFQTKPS